MNIFKHITTMEINIKININVDTPNIFANALNAHGVRMYSEPMKQLFTQIPLPYRAYFEKGMFIAHKKSEYEFRQTELVNVFTTEENELIMKMMISSKTPPLSKQVSLFQKVVDYHIRTVMNLKPIFNINIYKVVEKVVEDEKWKKKYYSLLSRMRKLS